MQHANQAIQKLNTTEVILSPDTRPDGSSPVSLSLPKAPLDWPVERFSQALTRREENRKALLKWIQSNLQVGVDFG